MFAPFDRRIKYLRVMLAVRAHGPLRYNQTQKLLGLTPAEVGRIMETLTKEQLVHPRAYGKKGTRILLEYGLSKKGEAHLKALDAYRAALVSQREIVGETAVRDLEALYA